MYWSGTGRLPAPNGWASWTGRIGKTDYSLGANGYSLLRRLPGDRLLLDGERMVTGSRTDRSPRSFYEISVNAEASRAMFGGRTRVTGQAYRSRYHERSRIHTFSRAGDPVEDELNPYTESKRSWEGGFSHDRAVGRWDLTLAGLLTRTRFQSDVSSTHARPIIGIDAVFAQALARNSGESILRASLGGAVGPRHRVEAGAEAAINSLGQKLALSLDVGGGPFPIPVPNSNLEVKERRGEVYLVDRWTLSRRWSVESRLAAELSRLSFSGDTQDSVSLAYLKPSLQVTRGLGARDQLRLRLHRDVGQLDFTNFVSAASLSDDIIKGGNPALRPETSWRLEGVADLRFGRDGAATITLFRHWISDVVDLVPVGEPGAVVDAPGNIGRGEVKGVQLNLRLPVAPFIRGGALTLDGTWRRSRVTDPLTGRRRPITGFEPLLLKAEFRQDLPARKLAWGLKYTGKSTRIFFRLNETDRRRDSPSLDLWAETTALSGFKLRATFVGLLDQPELRERSFFAPDRNGERVGIERSKRRPGAWLQLAVSGSF